jgi:hypothetical protein
MNSLYDELSEKLKRDPRLTRRGGPRVDIGLLLFEARDELHGLWLAAERSLNSRDADALAGLAAAVEKLRPLFGERSTPAAGV